MRAFLALLSLVFIAVVAGCSGGDSTYSSRYSTGASGSYNTVEEGAAVIQDRTGKSWDVTHARDTYGLNPSGYQYGLGPYAIPPLMNPAMIQPGDEGYPSDRSDFFIMGVQLNGFTRAYPIQVMSWHEVVNETFGDAHVAVAY